VSSSSPQISGAYVLAGPTTPQGEQRTKYLQSPPLDTPGHLMRCRAFRIWSIAVVHFFNLNIINLHRRFLPLLRFLYKSSNHPTLYRYTRYPV
jgi:hypothetical protein